MAGDPSVEKYRERYRQQENSGAYPGWLHFAFTSGVSLLVVFLCLAQLHQIGPLEWATVPLVFLYANLVEYFGHRGPMHHPVRGLGLIFKRHTKQHHRFFTDREMTYDSSHDFKAVLFPPLMILFFIGGFGVPMWLLLDFAATENVAWLAVATGIAYFLNYEWLHFAYHCDPQSRIGRIPGVQKLRNLHLHHHNPRLMTRYNFNITYPIGDWLFRTRYR
ncbi:MAG: fatty acid hydroxylase family protein [Xanthomonadales bacterium]|nr:sterol desaturase family protein [Gammaproteobacteria bacterium]MBT8052507.1 sterol desaturase family protein [Gammaproteobacteria bacterium]NND57119.1 fatty acid hydroxylase family protein [Xanthomonadales bacterium]NNK52769.1 fatty acid hydroxylase family protein [Xanthomonadales bacterium]